MKKDIFYKKEIVRIGKTLHQKNFVASNDGNLSIRKDNKIFITPTCVSKGFLSVDHIVEVDLEGNILKGTRKPTSEILMHLTVYKNRPDINAVCHAHPIYATAFASIGKALDKQILPEVIISLDKIPLVKYATPGTEALSKKLLPFIKKYDAMLLENHGVLSMGADLLSAYFKLETVEHFAQICFVANQIGKLNTLSEKEIQKLISQREKFGIRGNIGR